VGKHCNLAFLCLHNETSSVIVIGWEVNSGELHSSRVKLEHPVPRAYFPVAACSKAIRTRHTPNPSLRGIFLPHHPNFTVHYLFSRTHHPLYLILHTNYHPRAPRVILLPPPLSFPHLLDATSSLLCSLRWRP
jgi:hypothetical protein